MVHSASVQPHKNRHDNKFSTHGSAGLSPVIEVERLSVAYGKQTVLSDVNLCVNSGELLALVGPSGCGKSSFLHCLNRMSDLVPDCRVQGRIRVDGVDVLSQTVDLIELRKRVGLIFQKPNPFPLSIWKNLALPLKEHTSLKKGEMRQRITQVLQQVGLWNEVKDRLSHSALALSGGQQQRLCIARALMLEPQILLLDEPCSALDPIASATVEDLICGLRKTYTLVMVTHNLAQAKRIADRTAVFWMVSGVGRLIEVGQTQQIFNMPQHELTRTYITGLRG